MPPEPARVLVVTAHLCAGLRSIKELSSELAAWTSPAEAPWITPSTTPAGRGSGCQGPGSQPRAEVAARYAWYITRPKAPGPAFAQSFVRR